MSVHVTISDKDRARRLLMDGQWHALDVLDLDKTIKKVLMPPPGTYEMTYHVNGRIVSMPASRLEHRIERYPIDLNDHGTAWDYTSFRDLVKPGFWFGRGGGKVVIYADGTYSTGVGIDYRGRSGFVYLDDLVIKFVRQIDG